MKKTFFLSFLFLLLFIPLGFSNIEYVWNTEEVFIYNNDLWSDSTTQLNTVGSQYYGWEVITDGDCYLTGGSFYKYGQNFNCKISQELHGNFTEEFGLMISATVGSNLVGVVSTMDICMLNSTHQNCINYGEGIYTNHISYFNMSNVSSVTVEFTQTSTFLEEDITLDYLRLLKLPVITSSTGEVNTPENNSDIYSPSLSIDYRTSVLGDLIKYYYPTENIDYKNLGSGFSYLNEFGEVETGIYSHTGSFTNIDDELRNMGLYTVNLDNNQVFTPAINLVRLDYLQNYEIDYDTSLSEFTISFDEPDDTSYLSLNPLKTYKINILDYVSELDISLLFTISFDDDGFITTGTKDFGDFEVERTNEGKLIITYSYAITESTNIKSIYYATQSDASDVYYHYRNYHFFTPDFKSVYLVNYINATSQVLLNTIDSTIYPLVYATVFVTGDNIEWAVTHTTQNDIASYLPVDYDTDLYLNLSRGYNHFRFYDTSNDYLAEYTITYLANFSLLNMSVLDRNYVQDCYTNETFSNCDFTTYNDIFYVKSFNDEPYIDISNIGDFSVETNVYCDVNGSYDLYYSDYYGSNNLLYVPTGRDDNINSMSIVMNPKLSQVNTADVYDYILSNPDIINNDEYDFNKIIMNYVSTLESSKKMVFLPKNKNCYMEQSYYDINTNRYSMNVSFKGSYSLLDDIKTSGLYFEIFSGCYLDRFQQNTFIDYGNYYSCLLTTFIADNSTTYFYLTYILIALIIFKVSTGLAK